MFKTPKTARDAATGFGIPVCAVCGVEAAGKSRCSGCHSVNYCSREHQKEHWKTGGHREACKADCTRCLEPMSANNGICYVDHPTHLLRNGEKVQWMFQTGARTRDAMCMACDSALTKAATSGCRDCDEDEAIVEGPIFCFEGKHTFHPLPASDKRRVWKDVVTLLPKGRFQRKLDGILSAENEKKVTVLNLPGRCDENLVASINHRMSNLTTLRILDHSGLRKLRLTADLTPKLVDLELSNVPEDCKFHVVVPTLKNIWIHHFRGDDLAERINSMLAAATELETFETYKLWVSEELHFASNHLKTIDLHRSDGLPGISFWAPNLEKLRLQGCFSIWNIEILKSHPLAETLPEGHEPTKFRVNTLNANIGAKAMKALKKSRRCIFEENVDDGLPGVGAMEAHHKEFHKMMANYDEDDGLMGMIETITTQMAATDKKLKELEADDE